MINPRKRGLVVAFVCLITIANACADATAVAISGQPNGGGTNGGGNGGQVTSVSSPAFPTTSVCSNAGQFDVFASDNLGGPTTWTSDNSQIASVTSSGRVTPVSAGGVNLTATAVNNTSVKKVYPLTIANCNGSTGNTLPVVFEMSGPFNYKTGNGCTLQYSYKANQPLNWFIGNPSSNVKSNTLGSVSGDGTNYLTVNLNRNANGTIVATGQTLDKKYEGSITINASNEDCVPVTPPPVVCPTGFTTCNGPTFGAFRPADTTITVNTRYDITGKIYVPAGMSTAIEVLHADCVAYITPTPTVTSTNVQYVYDVRITMQGIAAPCTHTPIQLRFAAAPSVTNTLYVTVVAKPGISINAPGTGRAGTFGRATCSTTGLADIRCHFYSTDPGRALIVQKDTTYPANTAVWGGGFRYGGEFRDLAAGNVTFCAYSPSDITIVACQARTVSASLMAGIREASVVVNGVELHSGALPKELDDLYKARYKFW